MAPEGKHGTVPTNLLRITEKVSSCGSDKTDSGNVPDIWLVERSTRSSMVSCERLSGSEPRSPDSKTSNQMTLPSTSQKMLSRSEQLLVV